MNGLRIFTSLLLAPLAALDSSSVSMHTAPDNHDAHDYSERIRRRFITVHKTQSSSGSSPYPPPYSSLAFRAFLISASIIACVTLHFAGSASVLPA